MNGTEILPDGTAIHVGRTTLRELSERGYSIGEPNTSGPGVRTLVSCSLTRNETKVATIFVECEPGNTSQLMNTPIAQISVVAPPKSAEELSKARVKRMLAALVLHLVNVLILYANATIAGFNRFVTSWHINSIPLIVILSAVMPFIAFCVIGSTITIGGKPKSFLTVLARFFAFVLHAALAVGYAVAVHMLFR